MPSKRSSPSSAAAQEPRLCLRMSKLHQDPANVRAHPARALETLTAILARFGQQKPIVVSKKNVIIAGNLTYQAAAALGWKEIWVSRSALSDAEATAWAIADNRAPELSSWDFEGLSKQMQALMDSGVDLAALGWSEAEWTPLLNADWSPRPAHENEPAHEGVPIRLTLEERATFDATAAAIRAGLAETITDGAVLVRLCTAYKGSKTK